MWAALQFKAQTWMKKLTNKKSRFKPWCLVMLNTSIMTISNKLPLNRCTSTGIWKRNTFLNF